MKGSFSKNDYFTKLSIILVLLFGVSCSSYKTPSRKVIPIDTLPSSIQVSLNDDGRIFINAQLKDDSVSLMLDTYAGYSIFPEQWVGNYGLEKTPIKHITRDYLNKRSKSRLHTVDSLVVGNSFYVNNLLIKPSKILDPFNVGILGLNILNEYNWKFRFADKELDLDKEEFPISSDYIVSKFTRGVFPYFILNSDGIEQKMIVDLGAGKSLYIPAKSELGQALIQKYQPSRELVTSGGANSNGVTDYQYNFTIPEIELEGQMFKDVDITLSESSKLYFIGTSFLSKGELIYNPLTSDSRVSMVAFKLLE